jgi:dTDP-4-amino-4,6-dideoxygalactose transaminase
LVTTDNDEYAYIIKLFRDHGRGKGGFESIGYNSRLDAVQALYLHLKLPDLDDSLYERVENARLYNQLLEGSGAILPQIPEGDLVHTFNLYTIRVHDRARLRAYLSEKGVGTAVYYDTVMPLTPALAFLGHQPGEFPNAEEAARTVVSLPVWPGMTKRQIEYVAGAVREFLRNNVPMPAEK